MDHHALTLGELGPVAVAPHPQEELEVGFAVPRPVRIVPELDRHAGERLSTDQLARLIPDGPAGRIVDVYRHSQAACLQLAGPHRGDWISQRKAGNDVGPTADAREMQVLLDVAI